MANLNQPFNTILTTLFFLFFLMIFHTASSSSHSSNKDIIKSQNPSSVNTELSHYHQVFYLKNTDHPPMFLSRQERIKKMRMNRNKNKNMMKRQSKQRKQRTHRKKMVKKMMKSPKPFSVMLPKGFVPPSGSSPCHNDQPNSVNSFHCYLASTEP